MLAKICKNETDGKVQIFIVNVVTIPVTKNFYLHNTLRRKNTKKTNARKMLAKICKSMYAVCVENVININRAITVI